MSFRYPPWETLDMYDLEFVNCFVVTPFWRIVLQGIPTGVEIFNEIMRQHEREAAATNPATSSDARVEQHQNCRLFEKQCVRAVGVAIVLQGSMHPAMELLLRHTIQYFGTCTLALAREACAGQADTGCWLNFECFLRTGTSDVRKRSQRFRICTAARIVGQHATILERPTATPGRADTC